LLSIVGGSAVEAAIVCPANKPFHQAAGTYPDACPNCSHGQAPYHQACQDPRLQLRQCWPRGKKTFSVLFSWRFLVMEPSSARAFRLFEPYLDA
jgi:hypothetical protein